MANEATRARVRYSASGAEFVLSVLTGSLLLAKAGILDGLRATTHHDAVEEPREVSPRVTVSPGERFIDNGRAIVSAGISAVIDMALHAVARLHGGELARMTALCMEYDSRPER